MVRFFKKYHKWIGVIITLLLLLFSVSGIILNHRQLFSSWTVPHKLLPNAYQYRNWNFASVKKVEPLGQDSSLVYGNTGIWLTDSNFTKFTDFSQGFPKGIDNKKIAKIHKTQKGQLFAATLFGLYRYEQNQQKWKFVSLPLHHETRIVDISEKDDTLLVLSRSFLFSSTDGENFIKHQLEAPDGYDNKIGLFKTLWIIHSGEIYGTVGKLIVDGIGIIFIFLTITGFILFINHYLIKRKKRHNKSLDKIKKVNRWNLDWHNKIGWTTLIFLLITTITGMFLRPPLLIAIASTKVKKIPHTILDNNNAWFDRFRTIHYNKATQTYVIGTTGGMYYSKDIFNERLQLFGHKLPVSVMGITVFEQKSDYEYLIGSFEGLFLWNSKTGSVWDYITKKPYVAPKRKGPPIGAYLVSGYFPEYKGKECFFDYNKGLCTMDGEPIAVKMPDHVREQPMSLWNVMLEVHTGRIFEHILGMFYILIVPLLGLTSIFVLISGFVVWYKRHRKKYS